MNTAVCFISFNRPEYFAQCLQALMCQRNAPKEDWYLFQDGWLARGVTQIASEKLIQQCVELFDRAELPGLKEKHVQNENLGIARNQWRAFEYLLMEKKYDAIIIVEDDLVVSSDWLRLTHVLLDQFRDNKKIATVQASCTGGWLVPYEDKVKWNTAMCIGKPHWWGTALYRDRWEQIRVPYQQYYEYVKQFIYHVRDHDAIRRWYRQVWKINEDITSQDRAKDWSCYMCGMTRAFTYVNRARYIGMHGVHANPGNFNSGGYAKMTINDMPQDMSLDRFDDIPDSIIDKHLLNISNDHALFSTRCDFGKNDR